MILNKFRQFMAGRYGSDELNLCFLVCYLILSILSIFFPNIILFCLELVIVVLLFARMFSKNTTKRYQENQKFLGFFRQIKGFFSLQIRQLKEHKTHKFYRCEKCGQTIRVPKGKGKICITCPKCQHEFVKTT